MFLLHIYSSLQVIFLFHLACIADSERLKRQIIFEEDDGRSGSFPTNADCIMPNRERGICIRLTACQPMRRVTNWNSLQPYICGFEGSEPRVCCPYSEDENEEPRIIPTRRTTTTRRTTSTNRRVTPTTRRTTPTTRRTTPTTRRTTPTTRRTTPTTRRTTLTTRATTRLPVTPTATRQPVSNLQKPAFLPARCGLPIVLDTRVVGGKVAEKGSWPWMAVVFVEKRNGARSPDCGGALVTNRHVITAAHCVVSGRSSTTMSPRQLSVRLGAHDLRQNESDAMDIGIDAVKRHERFDPRTYQNDIAVLRLNRPISFTPKISPICLPYDNLRNEDLTDRKGTVIGFGTVAFNGPSSDVLRQATFEIQSQEVCKKAYEREVNITSVYMCAGMDSGEKDSCQGDSGGPLMSVGTDGNYYLVGIVSFGKLCGQPGYYGVYTRVTEFLDWLSRNLVD